MINENKNETKPIEPLTDFEEEDKEQASRESGEMTVEPPSRFPSKRGNNLPSGAGIEELRKDLVKQYHKGANSFVQRMIREGKIDANSRALSIIDELIAETDTLLGNALVFTKNGELREASVVSYKRAEVLEKAFKAVTEKQRDEQSSGVIDVDVPAMATIFRFFMSKMHEAFERIGATTEMNDIFFRKFGELTEDWRKDLKAALERSKVIP